MDKDGTYSEGYRQACDEILVALNYVNNRMQESFKDRPKDHLMKAALFALRTHTDHLTDKIMELRNAH